MVRLSNSNARGLFWASAHDRTFSASTVQGVFNAIDLYEANTDVPAASYIVFDEREFPRTEAHG